jgi:hypothetical protein
MVLPVVNFAYKQWIVMNASNISLFLLLASALPPALGAQAPAAPPLSPDIQATVASTQQIAAQALQDMPHILDDAQAALAQNERAITDKVIWQNTLAFTLFEKNIFERDTLRIGLFNRDFAELAHFGVGLFSQIKFINKITDIRIKRILGILTKDSKKFITELTKIEKAVNRPTNDPQKAKQVAQETKEIIDAFKKELKNSCQLIGYNPFKKELLVPYLALIGTNYLSDALRNKLLSTEMTRPEYWQRYEQDGTSLMDNPHNQVVSVVPFIKTATQTLINPAFLVLLLPNIMIDYVGSHAQQKNSSQMLPLLAQWMFPRLPSFIFTKQFRMLAETFMLGIAVKVRDQHYDNLWFAYTVENHAELLDLLIAYEKSLEKNCSPKEPGTLSKEEENLLSFIKKGHELKAWLPGKSERSWLLMDKKNPLLALQLAPKKVQVLSNLAFGLAGGYAAYRIMKPFRWMFR